MEKHLRSQSSHQLKFSGENKEELLTAVDNAFFKFDNNSYQQISISAFEVENVNNIDKINTENNLIGFIDLGPSDEYDEGAHSPAIRVDTIDNQKYRSTVITDHILERHKLYTGHSKLIITSKEYQHGMETSIVLIPASTTENIIEAFDGNNNLNHAVYHIVAYR